MEKVKDVLIIVAAVVVIAAGVMYVNANSAKGCFLGYCAGVIKIPG